MILTGASLKSGIGNEASKGAVLKTIAQLGTPRYWQGLIQLEGNIYIVGGLAGDGKCLY
jgi:hypothetical protein